MANDDENRGRGLLTFASRQPAIGGFYPALRLFYIVYGGIHIITTRPIGRIYATPNPTMERLPLPIDSGINKPMLHWIGVQIIYVLPEVPFIPDKVLPETVLP